MPFETTSFSSQGEPQGEPQGGPAQRELSILLVEDSAPLCARLIEMLTHAGTMRVTAVADTETAALELVRLQQFDVMVVDVELREGSGVTVVRKTRAEYSLRPFPLIIVLTNFDRKSVRERCLAAGADYFLDKAREFERLYPLILSASN